MNRVLLCLLTFGVLLGCARNTVTTVPNAWKNESYHGAPFEKLFILGVSKSDERRRLFEDSLARALASEGIASEASWRSLPTSDLLSAPNIGAAIAAGEFDGVLVTRLVEVDVRVKRGVDPIVGTPMYVTYRKSYDQVHDPNFFDPNADYRVETSLFSGETEQVVWMGWSVTAKPKSVEDGIDSLTRRIARTLRSEGLVATPGGRAP